MKNILLFVFFAIANTAALAYTPITVITRDWEELPIVVNDNADYFYAQQVCPPQLIVLPKNYCGTVAVPESAYQNVLLPE